MNDPDETQSYPPGYLEKLLARMHNPKEHEMTLKEAKEQARRLGLTVDAASAIFTSAVYGLSELLK
jgi:hypothetical protein